MSSKRRGISASQGPRKPPASSSGSSFTTTSFANLVLWIVIFCAAVAAYQPALNGRPLWDDSAHLTRPDLQSLHGLWRIWFELDATQQYYPLLHSAFWFEHQIWGDAVLGYHLVNVILHALSACLVVLIMKRLKLPGAWLAGFVFALHPVQVESVAWISEQKDTLSGIFCLSALLLYLHFDENRRKSAYFVATGLFVLALLSKTVTATLPAAILVIFWWRRGRLEWKRDVQPLVPWFGLGISAGLFTAWVERTIIGANGTDFVLGPLQRILVAGRAICFYFSKLLWPSNLTFFYPRWDVDPTTWWQWLFPVCVISIGVGLWLAAHRSRGPLASLLLFSGTLFPVLGFLNVYPFRYSFVADHFQYLASLGIIVPVSVLLAKVANRFFSVKTVGIGLSIVLVAVLGVLTWRQSRMYSDVETLYRTSLERNPASWMAHYNLGAMLAEMPGRLPEAIAEYEAALQIKPDCAEAHINLGVALSHTSGRLLDAIEEYQAALRIKPDSPEAHNNLGRALARIPGREEEAIAEYRAALRAEPDFAEAHYNLGNLFSRTGRQQEAIGEYQAALRIRPNYVEAHYNLAVLFGMMPGGASDSINEYQAALRIKPDFAEAHNNLGIMLSRTPGRLQEAITEYEEAVRIRPEYAEAHTNLGNALAQVPGRLADAIAEYETALRIRPDYADAHYSLGIALSQTPGRSSEAIAEYNAAQRISPAYAGLVSERMKMMRTSEIVAGN